MIVNKASKHCQPEPRTSSQSPPRPKTSHQLSKAGGDEGLGSGTGFSGEIYPCGQHQSTYNPKPAPAVRAPPGRRLCAKGGEAGKAGMGKVVRIFTLRKDKFTDNSKLATGRRGPPNRRNRASCPRKGRRGGRSWSGGCAGCARQGGQEGKSCSRSDEEGQVLRTHPDTARGTPGEPADPQVNHHRNLRSIFIEM